MPSVFVASAFVIATFSVQAADNPPRAGCAEDCTSVSKCAPVAPAVSSEPAATRAPARARPANTSRSPSPTASRARAVTGLS